MRQIGRLSIVSSLLAGLAVMLACALAPAVVASEPILALEALDGSTRKLTLQDMDALPQITIRTRLLGIRANRFSPGQRCSPSSAAIRSKGNCCWRKRSMITTP